MRLLGAVSRIEAVLLDAVLVFLIVVSAWFIVLRFSVSWPLNAVLGAAIVCVVGLGALQIGAATERTSIASYLLSSAVITVSVAWVFYLYLVARRGAAGA